MAVCVVQRAFERQYRAAVTIQRWLLRVRGNPLTAKAACVVQALWRGRVGTKYVHPAHVTNLNGEVLDIKKKLALLT